MTEISKATGTPSQAISPYEVKVGGAYRGIKLNDKNYHGAEVSVEVGQSFPHQKNPGKGAKSLQGFIAGQASVGWHAPQSEGAALQTTGFAFKGGVKKQTENFSASLWGSIGTEFFNSERVNPKSEEIPVALNNEAGLSLGAGINFGFFRDVLSLEAGMKSVLGIPGDPQTEYPWPAAYNSLSFFAGAGLNLAKLVGEQRGFAEPDWEKFREGLVLGVIADSSYTYNFNRPADGTNALRIFDKVANTRPMGNLFQISLKRPADQDSPIGFGIVLDVGENVPTSAAADSFNSNYHDLQQLFAEVYAGKCNVQVGKFATIIGYEVLEPVNNQLSRSWQFGLAIPFTHGGALASCQVHDKVTLKFGGVNNWDALAKRNTGFSGIYGLFADPTDWLSLSVTGATGVDQSVENTRLLNIVDGIITLSGGKRFPMSLSFNGDWGYQGNGGEDNPQAHWLAGSLNPRIDFNHYVSLSARGEILHDPEGVRTGNTQTLGHVAGTGHLRPVPEKYFMYIPLEIRLEARHDQALGEATPFLKGDQANNAQTTLALSATFNFANLLDPNFWKKKEDKEK